MRKWPDDNVILFDGVCIFCSRWVRFVAQRDTARRFRFTPIQSSYGTRLALTFGIDPDDPENFRRAITPNTRALYAETIGNPKMNVLDIADL